jgi:predicted peptidase
MEHILDNSTDTTAPDRDRRAHEYFMHPGQQIEFVKDFVVSTGKAGPVKRCIKFLFCVPKGYDPAATSVPLVLFLHGSSARGDNFDGVSAFALPKLLNSDHFVSELDMFVVSPLCPKGIEWKDPVMCSLLIALLDDICSSIHNIDKTRIYCTGLSMGGLGTWMLAARNPERFAALAPICGGGAPVYARILSRIPIHFFHSEEDNVVSVLDTDLLVDALRKENAVDVRYTRYTHSPDPSAHTWMVGHNCWDKAYSDPEFWQWFLSRQR